MFLLLFCSMAFTWNPSKKYINSINTKAVYDKRLALTQSKQPLLSKVGGGLVKYSTKITVWIIGGLAWGTLALSAYNTIILPHLEKKETFNWSDVMSDPTFKKNLEQLRKNEEKMFKRLTIKSNHNLVEKVLEILTKYWYLFLAVIIFITVSTIFYAKAGNGDGSKTTTKQQQQQIHVLRVNHKKLAALKIHPPKRRRRRRRTL